MTEEQELIKTEEKAKEGNLLLTLSVRAKELWKETKQMAVNVKEYKKSITESAKKRNEHVTALKKYKEPTLTFFRKIGDGIVSLKKFKEPIVSFLVRTKEAILSLKKYINLIVRYAKKVADFIRSLKRYKHIANITGTAIILGIISSISSFFMYYSTVYSLIIAIVVMGVFVALAIYDKKSETGLEQKVEKWGVATTEKVRSYVQKRKEEKQKSKQA